MATSAAGSDCGAPIPRCAGVTPPRALGRLHPSFMGKDRIRYRVVDEYNGDTLSEKRTRSSKQPSSEVYPQFEAAIRARIDGWYAEGEAERPA